MADDGAWPNLLARDGGGDARRAVDQLRAVIDAIEDRLGAPSPALLRPEASAALAHALEALRRRLSGLETATDDRYAHLTQALVALAARLEDQTEAQARLAARVTEGEARLERALMELATVRARSEPGPIRLVLTLASGAAAVAVMGACALLLTRIDAPPQVPTRPLALQADLPLRPGPAIVAPATTSERKAPSLAPPAGSATGARDSYSSAVAALARGEATAVPRLAGLAESGDTAAQRHLASLYETGASGVPRDPAAARAWTERAARAGDRLAMHNLALFLANGEGGPADAIQAVAWFRRAAEQGVVDSQYNLGLMYEAGRGVEKNLREAYRWFAVAANAGDLAAREKQLGLEGRLAAGERAALDRDVAGFRPGAAQAPALAPVIPPATTIAETQALLARQGYYVGPVDGISSPVLRAAATTYLRDHPAVTSARRAP